MERVLIRSIDLAPKWSLVFEMAPMVPILATVARAILGDRTPVIAWDDSGPGSELIFPGTPQGYRLAKMLRNQLNDALREDAACPAESFPEPGAPDAVDDVDADDFAEPSGGEFVRVLREEAAHLDALRAKAERSADVLYGGWRPGERFVVGPKSDLPIFYAACHLWAGLQDCSGRVIDRVLTYNGSAYGEHALLVQIDDRTQRVTVPVGVLSACAKKVTA